MNTDPQSVAAVAQRFFAAVESGDIDTVAAIYHPGAVIWHNHDRTESSVRENLEVLARFVRRAPTRRYMDRRIMVTPHGFVQQHTLEATRVDGRRLSLPACVIGEVRDGRIMRIDEYFDTAPLAGWYDL
jgi:ketosteroid isomerase-like protein